MRSKSILIAAAGMAALVLVSGYHLSKAPVPDEAVTPEREMIAGDLSRFAVPVPTAPPTATPAAGAMDRSAGLLSRPAPSGAPEKANALGIRPEHLDDARKLADDMDANREQYQAGMRNPAYFNQSMNSEDPSRKLALRLGLDADTAKKAEAVLSAHRAQQIQRRLDAEQERLEREGRLLAGDRESYVSYLALQSMAARGETLTKDQQAFSDRFRGMLEPAGTVPAPSETTHWHEDTGLLQAMNAELSAEQQAGLADYVEEQKRRTRETQALHAHMRSNMIAEKLGLDDADRTALYEYLQQHPGASRTDISKIVAAELVELLPKGM